MPELPEVEVARHQLSQWLVGRTIQRVVSNDNKVVVGPLTNLLTLHGRQVTSVGRRGKWLRLVLDDNRLVFSHLGMTGKWRGRSQEAEAEASERLRIDLQPHHNQPVNSVRYVDPRRFGRLSVTDKNLPPFDNLGPDPLLDGIDTFRLEQIFGRHKTAVKVILMNNSTLAGVGNIQSTESLFLARLNPMTPACLLTRAEIERLSVCVLQSIQHTIASEMIGEINYLGDKGAINPFHVYGRGLSPCPECGCVLVCVQLQGRVTTYCARCQPVG